MKKLFVSMVLGLVVLLGGVNFASAEDVYVCNGNDCEWYVDNNSVRGWPEEFTCRVGAKNLKTKEVGHYTFAYVTRNGIIMGAQQGQPTVIVTPKGQRIHWAIYTKALRYLKHIAQ